MAYIFVFRRRDHVRLSQSTFGDGDVNPAQDFQWFIPDYEVEETYRFVMRVLYVPFMTPEDIERIARWHLKELNGW